ncbi:hypothetical protein P692DRAFT_20762079 [Suillus brevipes Sb2]|nr:hypothetical protein P692DRAFT_20762079 [Suillus brevipes Sb2]
MSPSCLPPFNSSAIRIGMSELSNILTGPQWLDFYIRLIPTEAASPSLTISLYVRTELYLLYFLLKGRVYLGDMWQMVGVRLLEAQREESLRSISGDNAVRAIVERAFMEEKRNRCQLEVSLCSQGIDCVQQRRILPMRGVAIPAVYNTGPFSAASRCVARPAAPYSAHAVAYMTAVKRKCEGWLNRQQGDFTPAKRHSSSKLHLRSNDSASTVHHFDSAHRRECQSSVIVNPIDPSFCLSSTWVPFDVQDSLNKARKAESSTQAGLVATYLDIDGYNSHQRNTDSELLYLRAKMHRAKAEVEVYELAIENVFASNSPDSASSSSSHPTLAPLLSEEIHRYKEYINIDSVDGSSSEHLW